MAQVVAGNQVKLSNGSIVSAQQGGWYDGQQFWGGSLSNPGQINSQSNQQGAGQQVSQQVIAQTNPNNVQYVQQQRQQQNLPPAVPDATMPGQPGFQADNGGGASTGSTANGAGVGIAPASGIDLPSLYKNLQASSGVSDIEKTINDKTTAYNDAKSKINDNPYLSEGERTGRVQKLSNDYENSVKADQDNLQMKKADIQTQLDLQTKQFDINSQQAQQSMEQFKALLESGALANANGSDIANLTRATGLSSSMIQSAIEANQKKNQNIQIMPYDDGTNQGFAVVNGNTGQIISKQVIAGSKPTKGSGSGVVDDTRQLELEKQQTPQVLLQGAKMGKTLDDMIAYGASMGVSPKDVYDIYKGVNYYKATAAQQKADMKKYGIK